jgi:carboxyl-terminal processing protease
MLLIGWAPIHSLLRVRTYIHSLPSFTLLQGGIQKGDTFLEVDGVKFDDGKSTPDDVASKLRGPEGSKVGIVMQRDGKVQDFILTREPITITSVRSYISDKAGVGKIGVVRIKSFSGTTAQTVKDAIADLKRKGAEAFVLDLRGNPGGLLPGGVDTAALFLEANKPVVYVVDKRGVQDNQFTYQDGPELDAPLVVVVNSSTASAAEVMTAALKENQRATIVGEQTFGKGIIQTIRQLGYDNGGVAVTVARYETPLHNNINKSGISVDFRVDCVDDDATLCVPAASLKK